MRRDRLSYLILALTSRCNLYCSYCHQSATVDGMDMPDEVIDKAMEYGDTGSHLLIQITGGEPTIVPEKIERVISKSRTMKRVPQLALQTNATLLTDSLTELFLSARMQVGVSLDGPPGIQERLRGGVDRTLKGLELLERNNVPFRITTVVSEVNVSCLDKVVLLLAGFGSCRGIGLDLLVKKGRCNKAVLLPPGEEELDNGIRRMIRTLKLVNAKRKIPLQLRELDLVGKAVGEGHFCHGASGRSLAVHPNGSLYPCGQTLGDDAFFMGELDEPKLRFLPVMEKTLMSENCGDCSLASRCPGECPSRLHYNKDAGSDLACILYRCLDEQRR